MHRGLYDAFIKWQNPENNFAMSIGSLDYVYKGMARSTSSKRIKNGLTYFDSELEVFAIRVIGGYNF